MPVIDENTPHILIVDDDTRIRTLLKKYLSDNGFRTTIAADGREALAQMEHLAFDLVVLDIMMPDLSGLEVTERLRRRKNPVPVLLLTARAEVEDRIAGLSIGADDYLTKPFDPKELLLRIHSILRRSQMESRRPSEPPSEINFGPFVFKYQRGELLQGEQRVTLTTREIEVMRKLTSEPGRIVTREELSDDHNVSERAIDVQINRLRRKIEDDPRDPIYLQTVRGSGYLLRTD
jgi:two-component system phosphate regulon response regulator OmpR